MIEQWVGKSSERDNVGDVSRDGAQKCAGPIKKLWNEAMEGIKDAEKKKSSVKSLWICVYGVPSL